MGNRLGQLTISFVKRNARKRGPIYSDVWNDSNNELSRDLSTIYNEWNNHLYPLMLGIPDGTDDTAVDAFKNGLDGTSLYAKSKAVSTDIRYYNTTKSRPNTVYEQFESMYTQLSNSLSLVLQQVNSTTFEASRVPIADTSNVFTSDNVEDALFELYNAVSASRDHSTLANLESDTHPQYIPIDGSRGLTGNLQVNGYDLVNVRSIDGLSSLSCYGSITAGQNIAATGDITGGSIRAPFYSVAPGPAGTVTTSNPYFDSYLNSVVFCDPSVGVIQTWQTSVKGGQVNYENNVPFITLVMTGEGTLKIVAPQGAAASRIRLGAQVTSVQGYIQTTVKGSTVTLVPAPISVDGYPDDWIAIAYTGTWTVA